jgi:4-phytase/acid phosphatase
LDSGGSQHLLQRLDEPELSVRIAASLLTLLLACTPAAVAAPILERVVILQRHGVRAPTKSPEALAPFAQQPWVQWPVAPGELTDHGAAALARMGEGLRRHYEMLLGDCGRVYVWSDNADQRTRVSGNTMAAALALGCNLTAAWAKGEDDPIFHGDRTCPADDAAARDTVAARLPLVIAARQKAYDAACKKLAEILGKDGAADTSVRKGGKLEGALGDASSLTENLYLEYAQGMAQPGWGRLSRADLDIIMPLHDMASDLTRRTPLLAAHNGALLAQQIAALLTGAPNRVAAPDTAKLVVLAGHDTNLSNIAALLGVNWTLPGQPDSTAPDTALAFEVWNDKGQRSVRLRLFYQTLAQLRDLSVVQEPQHRNLALPDCKKDCSAFDLTQKLRAAKPRECVSPVP